MSAAVAPPFVECSQVEVLRANFFISLFDAGKTDEEINAAYAAMLPAGGEAELAMVFYDKLKIKYVPFAGYLLARYNPYDVNVRKTVVDYATRYKLEINIPSYRWVFGQIVRMYGTLNAGGCEGIDIAEWGHNYWKV